MDLLAFLFKPLIKERRKNTWFPIKINLVFIFFLFLPPPGDSNRRRSESICVVVPVVHHKRQCCAKKSCCVWSSEGGDRHRCDVVSSSLRPALWLTEQRSEVGGHKREPNHCQHQSTQAHLEIYNDFLFIEHNRNCVIQEEVIRIIVNGRGWHTVTVECQGQQTVMEGHDGNHKIRIFILSMYSSLQYVGIHQVHNEIQLKKNKRQKH